MSGWCLTDGGRIIRVARIGGILNRLMWRLWRVLSRLYIIRLNIVTPIFVSLIAYESILCFRVFNQVGIGQRIAARSTITSFFDGMPVIFSGVWDPKDGETVTSLINMGLQGSIGFIQKTRNSNKCQGSSGFHFCAFFCRIFRIKRPLRTMLNQSYMHGLGGWTRIRDTTIREWRVRAPHGTS